MNVRRAAIRAVPTTRRHRLCWSVRLLWSWLLAAALVATAQPGGQVLEAQDRPRIFVETVVDDRQPYVQQNVVVVVRLYYATTLTAGTLELDTPDGASLRRVGEDVETQRLIDGRDYNVVERRFLLEPERSGPLSLAGARFEGESLDEPPDDPARQDGDVLRARSPAQTLQVRALPAAMQPWLPLHELRLRYLQAPGRAEVGKAMRVVVEARALGATRAQLADLPRPVVDGAQVFAEPVQYHERLVNAMPELTLSRQYAIVPARAGRLRLSMPGIGWWDLAADAARQARLPELSIAVAAAAQTSPPVSGKFVTGRGEERIETAGDVRRPWHWIALTAGLALLWLATLMLLIGFWWRSRRRATPVDRAPRAPVVMRSPVTAAELRRALAGESLDEVALRLCAMAGVADLQQVMARLASAPQREAVRRLQRARWAGDGDPVAARRALREAFRDGACWQADAPVAANELEPLYPR